MKCNCFEPGSSRGQTVALGSANWANEIRIDPGVGRMGVGTELAWPSIMSL